MSGDFPENRSEDIRLSPRAVEDEAWIEEFLTRQPMCVLGLVDEGSPYLVNQLFVYDSTEHALFLHGRTRAKRGRSSSGPIPRTPASRSAGWGGYSRRRSR